MDRMRIEIEGSQAFSKALANYAKGCQQALGRALLAGANETRNMAVRSIQAHSSSGRVYKRRTVEHAASTPGNPPNTDTGNLVKNITVEDIDGGYDVGSRKGAMYGAALEFGTSKMAPRPWLQSAYDKAVKIVIDRMMRSEAAGK